MSLARFARCSLLSLTLFAINACSDDPAPAADADLPAHVSIQVGAKGGTLKASGGLTLEIPEGALDKNVKISATNAGQTAPKEIQAKQVSDLYEFGPEGTKFNKDVKVVFHTAKEEQRAEVYFTKEDGSGFEKIKSEKNGKEVTAFVKHFSQGFVGVPLAEEESDAGGEAEQRDAAPDEDAQEPSAAMDAGTTATPDAGDPPAADASDPGPPTDAGVSMTMDAVVDAALPKSHIMVHSRDLYGTLVNQTWAAYQDGQGAWQALAPSPTTGVYEFDVASATFGVAFVCSTANRSDSWNTVSFAPSSKAVLDVITQGPPCTVGTAPVMVNVQGALTMTNDLYWRIGNSLLTGGTGSYAGGLADFSINLRQNASDDLMFATGASDLPISRMLLRRDVMFSATTTGFNLDMDAGVPPLGTMQAQVLNASANSYLEVHYTTRNTDDGLLLNTTATTGTSTRAASFATVPDGLRRTADRYFLLGYDTSSSAWRKASLSTYAAGNMSVALPPAFTTVFSSLSTPYLRPSFGFTPLTGANMYIFSSVYSPVRGSDHAFTIEIDPAWLSGTGPTTLTFPDFSAVPGFQAEWVAPSAGSVSAKSAVYVKKSDASGDLKSESGQNATVP